MYYDVDTLTVLWRNAVLGLLRSSLRSGVLTCDKTADEMEAMLDAQERWWNVKIQSLSSVERFFRYIGRYARRPVIAQHRIIYFDDQIVRFWAKDKRSGKVVQILLLPRRVH